jgi:hypothetical protein
MQGNKFKILLSVGRSTMLPEIFYHIDRNYKDTRVKSSEIEYVQSTAELAWI